MQFSQDCQVNNYLFKLHNSHNFMIEIAFKKKKSKPNKFNVCYYINVLVFFLVLFGGWKKVLFYALSNFERNI